MKRTGEVIWKLAFTCLLALLFAEHGATAEAPNPLALMEHQVTSESSPPLSSRPSVSTDTKCSLGKLSAKSVDCWNALFGDWISFKHIVHYEITALSDRGDVAVVFIALGHPLRIPKGTLMLRDSGKYAGDGSIERSFVDWTAGKMTVVNKVLYGLIVYPGRSGKRELQLYGDTSLFEYTSETCLDWNAGETATPAASVREEPLFCGPSPMDQLPILESKKLFPLKPPYIVYEFVPGGDSVPDNLQLLAFEGGAVRPLFVLYRPKYGIEKIDYGEGEVSARWALHTPFQSQSNGHMPSYSFIVRTVFRLDKNAHFVIHRESMEGALEDANEITGDKEYVVAAKEVMQTLEREQSLFEKGKRRWLRSPMAYVRHICPKCSHIRIAFKERGKAIVWANMETEAGPKHRSFYLYKPFLSRERRGKRSIWQAADLDALSLYDLLLE